MSTTTDTRKATQSIVLTVGGSDSGGSAGIQADLKTFAARGVFGTTALTMITAQDTRMVYKSQPIPEEMIQAQIEAVLQDMNVTALKTGLLARATVIDLVARMVKQYGVHNVVIDPVLVNGKGESIVAPEAISAYRQQLFPLAKVITPNLDEASLLAEMSIESISDMQAAAIRIHKQGAPGILIKGGHLTGTDFILDIFYDGSTFLELQAFRLLIQNPHGVGCTLAAAIAAELAKGQGVTAAVKTAHAYLQRGLAASWQVGKGRIPVHHGVDCEDKIT